MEKHAVPQNIMDVEFKLFGALTVRQFSYVAFSAFGALVIYSVGLPTLVSLPIIVVMIGIGLAMAFLTVNGQPFATWFGNFSASLFLSQRKVYRKTGKTPTMLKQTRLIPAVDPAAVAQDKPVKNAAYQQKLKQLRENPYDSAIVEPASNKTEEIADILDDGSRLASLDKYFGEKIDQEMTTFKATLPAPPPITVNQPASSNPSNVVTDPSTTKISLTDPQEYPEQTVPTPIATESVTVPTPTVPEPAVTESLSSESVISQLNPADINLEVNLLNKLKPNQIAGYVCDQKNIPIDRAEVMVKTAKNELLRAVYTDTKGKFIMPSPLPAGEYYVEIRKVGMTFPEYDLKLEGQVVPLFRYVAK